MREQLADIIRQTVPLFEKIKITGTATSTKVQALDKDKILFLVAEMKQPISDFQGEFGVGSLNLLGGLLNFASYKTDEATLTVRRHTTEDYVSELDFRDKRGGGTRFVTTHPKLTPQAELREIPWKVNVTPTKATITELTQLSSYLNEVDTMFGVKIENNTLFLTIGGGGSGTHTSSVAFADVDVDLVTPSITYNTKHLLSVLKNGGTVPSIVRFSEKGLAGVTVETDYGLYDYVLRGRPV